MSTFTFTWKLVLISADNKGAFTASQVGFSK